MHTLVVAALDRLTGNLAAKRSPGRPLDLRRALLGCLLVAAAPLTIAQLVDALAQDFAREATLPKRVADALRYQVALGRVRRVDRGVYEIVSGSMSRATAWRCVNWKRERERSHQRWVRDHSPGPAVPDTDHPPAVDVGFG